MKAGTNLNRTIPKRNGFLEQSAPKNRKKMLTLTLKKNQHNKPVVYGPLSVMRPGLRCRAQDANGKVIEVEIKSLGKPFKVNGCLMVYGYLTGGSYTHTVGESLNILVERFGS